MYVHAISERRLGGLIMQNPLYKRHLLTLLDFEPHEIQYLLDLAIILKKKKHANEATSFF